MGSDAWTDVGIKRNNNDGVKGYRTGIESEILCDTGRYSADKPIPGTWYSNRHDFDSQ